MRLRAGPGLLNKLGVGYNSCKIRVKGIKVSIQPGRVMCSWLFLVLQLISRRATPERQTTGSSECSSRASITPSPGQTDAIDAQGVPVSSPPELVRNWGSSTMPKPSTSETLTKQPSMSTTVNKRFSYQQSTYETSFDAYPVTYPTSTSSHNQVSGPFEIHLLNCSIHLIILVGRPDGYQPHSMATATEQCQHQPKLLSIAYGEWANILWCIYTLAQLQSHYVQHFPTFRFSTKTGLSCGLSSSAVELLLPY